MTKTKPNKKQTLQQKWKPGSLLRCKWLPNGNQYKDGKDRYGLLLEWQGDKCLMLPLSTGKWSPETPDWLKPNGNGYTNSKGYECYEPGPNGLTQPCQPSWDCGLLCTPESWWTKKGQLNSEELKLLNQYKKQYKKLLQWQEGQPLMPTGK
jgi:hypothetical protein